METFERLKILQVENSAVDGRKLVEFWNRLENRLKRRFQSLSTKTTGGPGRSSFRLVPFSVWKQSSDDSYGIILLPTKPGTWLDALCVCPIMDCGYGGRWYFSMAVMVAETAGEKKKKEKDNFSATPVRVAAAQKTASGRYLLWKSFVSGRGLHYCPKTVRARSSLSLFLSLGPPSIGRSHAKHVCACRRPFAAFIKTREKAHNRNIHNFW